MSVFQENSNGFDVKNQFDEGIWDNRGTMRDTTLILLNIRNLDCSPKSVDASGLQILKFYPKNKKR